jgi:hypothetical protein
LKKRLKSNSEIITIVQRGQAITIAMEAFIKDSSKDIEESYRIFTLAVQSLK